MWFFNRKTKISPNFVLRAVLAVLVLFSVLTTLLPLNIFIGFFASTKQICSMSCCVDGETSCCIRDNSEKSSYDTSKRQTSNLSKSHCHLIKEEKDRSTSIVVDTTTFKRFNNVERVIYLNQLALIEEKSKVNFSSQSLEKPCLCPISTATQLSNLESLVILTTLHSVCFQLTKTNSFFDKELKIAFEKFQKSHSRAPPTLT